MNAPMRRGACPALSAPMATGDGLLVRLNPVAAGLSPATIVGLCEAAERHGNGIVEVTARGSFQIRGLTAASVARLAAEVDALGIAVRTGVPVETGPLAGLDRQEIADPCPLADAIRAGIAAAGLAARLGPKVSVVVDGGGAPWLANVAGDVRLTAVPRHDFDTAAEVAWSLAIAGDASSATPLASDAYSATSIAALNEEAAVHATLAILGAVANIGRDARARDLSIDVARSLALAATGKTAELEAPRSFAPPSGLPAISPSRGEIEPAAPLSPSATVTIAGAGKIDGWQGASPKLPISPLEGEMAGRPEGSAKERGNGRQARNEAVDPKAPSRVGFSTPHLIGPHHLTDTRTALAVALPFGQIEARRLAAFLEQAERLGVAEIRLAPRRALILICRDSETARALRAAADAAGLIVDPGDPRLSISACPGAPACASGKIGTRALADSLAAVHRDLLDGSIELHVSGCAKGCAHPAAAALTIVGTAGASAATPAVTPPRGNDAALRAALVANGTASAQPLAHIPAGDVSAGLARMAALMRAERGAGETTAVVLARLGRKKLADAFQQEPE
jgi:precorrin-3B synthase